MVKFAKQVALGSLELWEVKEKFGQAAHDQVLSPNYSKITHML